MRNAHWSQSGPRSYYEPLWLQHLSSEIQSASASLVRCKIEMTSEAHSVDLPVSQSLS